jgi:hypothetical protein
MAFSSVLEPSSYLLGVLFWLLGILCAEVDDAWDDFWRGSFVKWLYLAAKPSHVGGVDVDGLACPLHRPMAHNYQVRG